MTLTVEQQRAVGAAGKRVAVVAGAGTGKTRVLTARYFALLEAGAVVPRVLALTFTEKAAREMKQRIRAALEAAGRLDLARQTEFAPISTIHSFLARVLRERALDAGVDPRFAIADELTAETYLGHALRETVDALSSADREALAGVSGAGFEGAEGVLRELYLAARATPLEIDDLTPPAFDGDAFADRMCGFLASCATANSHAKGTQKKLDGIRALATRFAKLDPEHAAKFHKLVGGNVAKDFRELFTEGKAIDKLYARLPYVDLAAQAGAAIVRAVAALDARYTERKRTDGLLDFSDLEREGLRLLRSPAAAAVRASYSHVLVDEYQDTSRIQEAIIEALATDGELFGVGDEKQSIYRFRYADAAIFSDLQGSADSYRLTGSFRSRPEIVSFNNELFRTLFQQNDVQPQDLAAAREWDEADAPCIELVDGVEERAIHAWRAEAEAIADRLRALVESGRFAYREAALLLRATTHLSIYERALADARIPYVVVRGRGYYAAREVVDLANLLLLLEDPADDYCAAAALTSLFCGVPETDLLHLPGSGPWPLRPIHAERPDAIPRERWDRLVKFANRFARWRRMAGRAELGELVETILRETRCDALMLMHPDGRRRYANLHKALRRARRAAESPAAYARALLEFREREQRESEAPIAAETDDAVKVMTIHAAKGLEFPLVAVGGLGAKDPDPRGPVLRPDGRFSFSLRPLFGENARGGIAAPGSEDIREQEKIEERQETARLYYVAFTRAERHLLLGGIRYGNYSSAVIKALPDSLHPLEPPPGGWRARRHRRSGVSAAAVRAAVRREATLPAAVKRDTRGAKKLLARIDKLPRRMADLSPYVIAVADLVEFERCPRRYRLKRMYGIEYDDPGEGRESADVAELPRRLLGTVFHELMAEPGAFAIPDESAIRKHLPDTSNKTVATIQRWAEWTRDLDLMRGLDPAHCHKEMPFLVTLGRWPVRGVIDLYSSQPSVLLDYKTGASVRPDQYAIQVAIYLAALRAMGLPAPDRAHLVYVDAQEVVEVADRPLDDLMHAFENAHERSEFEPTPGDACEHCEFKAACVANDVAVPGR